MEDSAVKICQDFYKCSPPLLALGPHVTVHLNFLALFLISLVFVSDLSISKGELY